MLTALVSIFPFSYLPNATLHWSTALPPFSYPLSLYHSALVLRFALFRKSQPLSPSPPLSLSLSYPPPSPKTDLRLTLTLSLVQKVAPASDASPSSRAIQGTHTLTPPLSSHSGITFSRLLLFEIKRTPSHGLGRVCHSCPWRLSGGIGPAQRSVEDLGGFFWAVSPSLFCIQEQSPSALETALMVPTWMWLRGWCTGDVLNFRPMKAGECWILSCGLWTGALVFCSRFVLFSYDKFTVFHSLSLSHKWCSGALYLFYTSLPSLCFGNAHCAWKCKW